MSAACTLMVMEQKDHSWVTEATAQPAVVGSLYHLLVQCLQAWVLCQPLVLV